MQLWLALIIFSIYFGCVKGAISEANKPLAWMVGKWRSEFSGKVIWPTIPSMTYGEELVIEEGEQSFHDSSKQFLNFSAKAWSHSNKDSFHNEWGFLTVEGDVVTLMTAGGNGFTKYEIGKAENESVKLQLSDIGRISFSRDLPVEALHRTFIKHGPSHMEQILQMRTATDPTNGVLQHSKVIYERIK
uniref:DUF1794 domain-containing protein n=1 Tax=Rhabditophanes sp. KR3021 TaxID=114890 RepID=A0AC35TVQ9_9BILA